MKSRSGKGTMMGSDGLPNEEAKPDQTNSRQSALISQSPLWYSARQELPLTPCSPKAEEAGGLKWSPFLPIPSSLAHTHTHTFSSIHTHSGPSFESLGLDLKFLFRACHAFYMHGEWERRGGIAWGYSPNELPHAAGLLREVSARTHACSRAHAHRHTHTLLPRLIFPHPLDSFNISFTASCFSQIPPSSKSCLRLWRQVWSELRRWGVWGWEG